MRFKQGRDNLALTIFVPQECSNACDFCTVREFYERKSDPERTIKAAADILDNYVVEDVVITGGEPFTDGMFLGKLLVNIPRIPAKKIYVNTTLPKGCFMRFSDVAGINVSRQGVSYDEDQAFYTDSIEDDDTIEKINKYTPVRINTMFDENKVIPILERWQGKVREVSFRFDYRMIGVDPVEKSLATSVLQDKRVQWLINQTRFKITGRTACNVCETIRMRDRITGMDCMIHQGSNLTSINHGYYIEVNDVIIMPDGTLCYDWGYDYPIPVSVDNSGWGISSWAQRAASIYQGCGGGGCGGN